MCSSDLVFDRKPAIDRRVPRVPVQDQTAADSRYASHRVHARYSERSAHDTRATDFHEYGCARALPFAAKAEVRRSASRLQSAVYKEMSAQQQPLATSGSRDPAYSSDLPVCIHVRVSVARVTYAVRAAACYEISAISTAAAESACGSISYPQHRSVHDGGHSSTRGTGPSRA